MAAHGGLRSSFPSSCLGTPLRAKLGFAPGEHTRPECWFWRLAKTNFPGAMQPVGTRIYTTRRLTKSVSAGRRHQHAGRVRSPEPGSPRSSLIRHPGREHAATTHKYTSPHPPAGQSQSAPAHAPDAPEQASGVCVLGWLVGSLLRVGVLLAGITGWRWRG